MNNNWKETLLKEYPTRTIKFDEDREVKELLVSVGEMYDFISTEIIEKLIEDIPAYCAHDPENNPEKKQQLRDKWL